MGPVGHAVIAFVEQKADEMVFSNTLECDCIRKNCVYVTFLAALHCILAI